MIIGLTGKSCSGKDYFATLMDKDKFQIIDEDKLGHIALKEQKDKLITAFGSGILTDMGEIDRKKLGSIVFSDSSKLKMLNSIVHPYMVKHTLQLCSDIEKEGKIPVINAAILEEMGFVPYCNQIVLVLSKYENRLKRAMERDNISEESFRKRTEAQLDIGTTLFSSGKKIITIFNDGTKEYLSRQVKCYCDTI